MKTIHVLTLLTLLCGIDAARAEDAAPVKSATLDIEVFQVMKSKAVPILADAQKLADGPNLHAEIKGLVPKNFATLVTMPQINTPVNKAAYSDKNPMHFGAECVLETANTDVISLNAVFSLGDKQVPVSRVTLKTGDLLFVGSCDSDKKDIIDFVFVRCSLKR